MNKKRSIRFLLDGNNGKDYENSRSVKNVQKKFFNQKFRNKTSNSLLTYMNERKFFQ